MLCLAGCLIAVGCGDPDEEIPLATPEMALAVGVEPEELARGRDLYLTHCGTCHDQVKPRGAEPENWPGILPHMAQHAALSSEVENELLSYLLAAGEAVDATKAQQ